MHEIPPIPDSPIMKNAERLITKERVVLQSELESPQKEHKELSVAIAEDGKLRRINFWDLDKTLLYAEPVHGMAVEVMFPEVDDKKELRETYFAGFTLGNSFREWDRMIKIYREGQTQYKDPEHYRTEHILNDQRRRLIDEAGHPELLHERADQILQRYGHVAKNLLEELFQGNPELLEGEKFLNLPVLHLLDAKTRLGEVNVYMTANQRDFARALVTYSGLWKYGFDLATDEDVVGGGKEIAIAKLLKKISERGLLIPNERLVVIGDSLTGDLGSGLAANKQNPDMKFTGVLIKKDMDELRAFNALVQAQGEDGEMSEIIRELDATVITSKEVRNIGDRFLLGRLGSRKPNEEDGESVHEKS